MKRAPVYLLYLLFVLFPGTATANDDFQYWSQYNFKVVDTEHVDFSLFTEGRFINNAEDNGLHLVQFKLSYHFFDHLDLGTNYTYLNVRTTNALSGDSEFKYQHRAELEINPKWNLGDVATFYNRNRVEFRWIEDKGSYNTRTRHRFRLTFPFKQNKWLKSVFVDSEFFYNWAENDYDENRTVPVGLNFKLTDNLSLQAYYMVQSRRGSQDWRSNEILGTLLSYKF
ncbi:MAG: DUF2490 domain-containing protein [Candidatus Omnitrophica bacterium]|nr:DUF2490 domain-containing protein [Candidatus Omnitrophota bacterium]